MEPPEDLFQNETETACRIKSRASHIYVGTGGSRRNSFPGSRRRSDGTSRHTPPPFLGDNSAQPGRPGSSEHQKNSRTIPEKVAQFFYTLGLFCSSHTYMIIALSCVVVVISCYPLFSLPFLGNKPKEFVAPYENYTLPPNTGLDGDWPRWYKGPPVAYVQQIVVKSAIVPWSNELLLTDAFRRPLAEVFRVIELTKNYQLDNKSVPLSQLCFSVGEIKSRALKGKISMLPEFGCLIVSPADFWQQRYDKFRDDPDVLATVLNYQSHQKGRSGVSEILLGMSIRDTGLKRFPLKSKPRVVSYAVTFVLQSFDQRYIDGLRQEITRIYPPRRQPNKLGGSSESPSNAGKNDEYKNELDEDLNMIHVYYPSQSSIFELIPLVVTYIAMFVYVYFSVKKIDIIASKLGMAISALATVVASLCMSVGLCSHFGVTFEVNAKAIYPYLVVIIGLENILVLTRSVVATPKNLDFKIRVAQGLSKEGWSITKNLLTEITILTIGFFTFIPAVQEFCILAIVGLLSDFFLQTFFFATVLSVDIHRQKFSPDSTWDIKYASAPLRTPIHPSDVAGIGRIKSNPLIRNDQNGTLKKSQSGISVVAPSHKSPIFEKIPKRLRLVYFWARTRFFQRTFTIFMIGWISVIIYESGIVARFAHEPDDVFLSLQQDGLVSPTNLSQTLLTIPRPTNEKHSKPLVFAKGGNDMSHNRSMDIQNTKLYRELYSHNPYVWRRLTPYHWQILFGIYNVTLIGKYITILPPICISVPVQPNSAVAERHPLELQHAKRFNWQALANAFDAIEVEEYDGSPTVSPLGKSIKRGIISDDDDPYIPTSPIELALTVLLAIPSILFIGYLVVVLYRCICSRNYAEWRSSWTKSNENVQDYYTQVVFEAVPLVLDGHQQEVECIGTDGNIVASVCLTGTLKVWYVSNGDNVVSIDRQRYFEQLAAAENGDSYGTWLPSDGESPNCSPTEESQFYRGEESSGPATNLDRTYEVRRNMEVNSSSQLVKGVPIPSRNSKACNSSPPSMNLSSSPSSKTVPLRGFDVKGSRSSLKSSKNNTDSGIQSESPFITLSEDGSRSAIPGEDAMQSPFIDDVPSAWCLECQENLVFLGTGCGRLEIWDAMNGALKCIYEDGSPAGIVCIRVIGSRVILARLNGSLDFLELESLGQIMEGSSSPYHRWHNNDVECYTNDPRTATFSIGGEQEIRCNWLMTQKAHQQPITCLECEGDRILTGSQDHTLKVFRVEDHSLLNTLYGHYGPITCLFIDKFSPMSSGSGSQDGMLCVWDLLTGMCMYSIQAHDGPVSAVTYSASYIISVGGDDKICVWERFQGHLLNTIQLDHAYCSSLVMLTQNLLITSKQGSLIVWDVRSGQPVRAVRLGHRDNAVFVRQIISCSDAVLCDYGSQLRIVRFPSVVSKFD